MFEGKTVVALGAGVVELGFVDRRFRRSHRLRTAESFALVFADRRRLRGDVFDLHYRLQSEGATAEVGARLGVVIAKKLAHRAVQRNLLRRLARESFRLARAELPPYDLVLRLARSPGSKLDRAARSTWCADIAQLLMRLPR